MKRALIVPMAVFSLAFASTAANAQTRPLHTFAGVAMAPDASAVASVETTEAPEGSTEPPHPAIVIRSLHGAPSHTIACPPAVKCRLSAPTWSPDARHL